MPVDAMFVLWFGFGFGLGNVGRGERLVAQTWRISAHPGALMVKSCREIVSWLWDWRCRVERGGGYVRPGVRCWR